MNKGIVNPFSGDLELFPNSCLFILVLEPSVTSESSFEHCEFACELLFVFPFEVEADVVLAFLSFHDTFLSASFRRFFDILLPELLLVLLLRRGFVFVGGLALLGLLFLVVF